MQCEVYQCCQSGQQHTEKWK